MKKILPILLIALVFGLFGCSAADSVIGSLPDYEYKVFYTEGAWQDFTEYGKYFYDSVTVQDLEDSEYFNVVTEADAEEILLHIEDFEDWVKLCGGEVKENYDFDKTLVTEGNYFYIKTSCGEPIGDGTYDKFDNYTVYYFDINAQTLYYFHNNV